MESFSKVHRIRPGDRVVVGRMADMKVLVEAVREHVSGGVEIILDWGEHGKSRVWLHDEGKTWFRYVYVN